MNADLERDAADAAYIAAASPDVILALLEEREALHRFAHRAMTDCPICAELP